MKSSLKPIMAHLPTLEVLITIVVSDSWHIKPMKSIIFVFIIMTLYHCGEKKSSRLVVWNGKGRGVF